MYGFSEDFAKEALNLTSWDKLILFGDTIPKQSVLRIISVLKMAETVAPEAKYQDHGTTVGELGNVADPSCYSSEQRYFCTSDIIICTPRVYTL